MPENSRHSREQKPTRSSTRSPWHSHTTETRPCYRVCWLHPPLEMAFIISLTVCVALLRGKTTKTICRYWACWRYQPDRLPQVQDCRFDCWCTRKRRALPTLRVAAVPPEPFKCRNNYPSTSSSSRHGDLRRVPLLCIISNIAGKCSRFVRLNGQGIVVRFFFLLPE